MSAAATSLLAPDRSGFIRAGADALYSSLEDGAPALRLTVIGEGNRQDVLTHLLRLSEADRRMRFMQLMSNEMLESHVAAIDLTRDVRLALFNRPGSLVALAEGFRYLSGSRREMEVAFSTDAPWRRRGLAKCLWTEMVERASDHGVERVVLHCDSRNAGMRGLLGAVGAQTQVEETEIHAIWPVPASC